MCVTATVAAVGSSMIAAQGQKDAAYAQAGQARVQAHAKLYEGQLDRALKGLDAENVLLGAQKDADNIKRQALLMRSQMTVAQSGSGVMIGEGSAQAAMDQLDALSSADALATLYSGINKSVSIRNNGEFAAEAGRQQNEAGQRAASSLEKAGDTAYIAGMLGAGAKASTLLK